MQIQPDGPKSQNRRFFTQCGRSHGTGAPCCPSQHGASEARGWHLQRRIHVVAGEAVGVLNDPLLIDIHEDLLATDGTDAVGEVLGGHP